MKETLQKHKQYLLTGVSHVVPFIACGGILIAAAIAFAPMTPTGPDFSQSPRLKLINDIGNGAFALALPVLAGFIAYGVSNRPGLVPGMLGGYLAHSINAGFIGALVAGLLAGHVVELIKRVPFPRVLKPIMPIIVIPICSGLIVGVVMLKVVGVPIADFMKFLAGWLEALNHGNAVLLAAILGAMIAFDMGGPVNKAAFFFGAAMIKEGNYAVMGACAAAICTPPLGLATATLIGRKYWSGEQRESGLAALGMGMIGITEGAIPFAAADPVRVIPSIMLGSMVAATIAMVGGVGDHAPHGGPIVLPVVDNRLMYVVAILAGVFVTAVCINTLKRFTEKPVAAPRQPRMKLIAVTACPTGIAHTYMAAEQLEKTAKKLGHVIKVETQGAMGIENELTAADIAAAEVAILATDIAIERAERFDRIRKVQVPVQAALKDPAAVLQKAAAT